MTNRIVLIFSVCLCAYALRASEPQQTIITNDTMVTTWSDSFGRADFGQRQNFFLGSYFISYYPQYFVSYRDHSRAGSNNKGMLTNQLPRFGIVDAGFGRGKTNGLNIYWVSGNGGFDSNAIYGYFKQLHQYPTNSYTKAGVLTGDWSQSNPDKHYKSLDIGDVIYHNLSGTSQNYSYGARSAAIEDGVPFVDTWVNMQQVVTDNNGDLNILWFPNGTAYDHPNNVFQLIWALTNLRSLEVDTNTYTCIIDFNAALAAQTNHCTATSVSLSGSTLTFTFHADRMAPGFYVPDGTITNDCRPAFTLMPSLGSQFCEILRVTNLPAGNYQVSLDGSNVVQLTDVQLAAGWNQFTNYNGAFWAQKKEILGLMCDLHGTSRADASTQTGNTGVRLYETTADTNWPLVSGVDNYIAEVHMAPVETGLITGFDVPIHTTAQQTNHTYSISLISPRLAPFHR